MPAHASQSPSQSPMFAPGTPLVGADGLAGEIEQSVDDLVIARLRDGSRILMRPSMLSIDEGGTARSELSREDVEQARQRNSSRQPDAGGNGGDGADHMIIPVLEERVRVGTEAVETGRVRIVKRVSTEEHEIEQPVKRQQVKVERVPSGAVVADPANPPQPRQEGQTLVIPLLEEVLVVEKRLVVREEVHIRRDVSEEVSRQSVTLRKEQAHAQRLKPSNDRETG